MSSTYFKVSAPQRSQPHSREGEFRVGSLIIGINRCTRRGDTGLRRAECARPRRDERPTRFVDKKRRTWLRPGGDILLHEALEHAQRDRALGKDPVVEG